jgi:site-specific recombinase XerD
MSTKTKSKEYIIRLTAEEYSNDIKKMFDYLRFKKATKSTKATTKAIDELVTEVRAKRKEAKQAMVYL